MKLFDQIVGYRTVSVPTHRQNQARRLLADNNIPFKAFKIEEEKSFFSIPSYCYKRVSQALLPLEPSFGELGGVPAFFLRHKSRYGILIGLILAAVIFFSTQNVVWDIRVSGNLSVSDEEIISELQASGFDIGTHFRSVDLDRLRNQILLNSEKISWISINMSGVVANIEVREYAEGVAETPIDASPCNVVAASDGQISVVTVQAGKKVVDVGQVVKEGELLISGVIDSQSLGVRYEHAAGEVLAYVNKEIHVEIPMNITEKTYTGKEFKKISLNIFGKTINIFTNCRNSTSTCDKITSVEQVTLFGRFHIPVFICVETHREYTETSKTLSVSQAVDLAMAELAQKTVDALEDAELISKEVTTHWVDEKLYVNCKIYCIEDIAKPLKFKIS